MRSVYNAYNNATSKDIFVQLFNDKYQETNVYTNLNLNCNSDEMAYGEYVGENKL